MSEWKYDVDEVGEDADSGAGVDSNTPDADRNSSDADRNSPGSGPDRPELEPLEPGSPTAENTLFVVLGVATMLFLFARVILVAGG